MKIQTNQYRFSILLALVCLFSSSAFAQSIKFGPRIAIGSSSVEPGDLWISSIDDLDALKVNYLESSPEFKAGFFGRVSLLGFYVQPEILLTTSSAEFLVEDLLDGGAEVLKERYYNLEIPIMAGIKLGPVRAHAGPVYHMQISEDSDFIGFRDFGREFRDSSVGIRAGLGLDLGRKLVLDFNYEFDVSNKYDEIRIFGQTHDLAQRGSQMSASLGYSF